MSPSKQKDLPPLASLFFDLMRKQQFIINNFYLCLIYKK